MPVGSRCGWGPVWRRSTIDDDALRGLLPSLKLGRHRRFVRTDVVRAIVELRRRGG